MNENLWKGGYVDIAASSGKLTMPTDEALEPIARRYCELMGLDPDEVAVTLKEGYQVIGRGETRLQMTMPIVRQHAALLIAFGTN